MREQVFPQGLNFDSQLSRRKALQLAAGIAGSLVVGCGGEDLPQPPTLVDYIEYAPHIENPVLRAASVVLFNNDGSGLGHGGIFQDDSGKLWLHTISHIGVNLADSINFVIPGFDGMFNTDAYWQIVPDTRPDGDPVVRTAFYSPLVEMPIAQIVNNGTIAPLRAVSYKNLTEDALENTILSLSEKAEIAYLDFSEYRSDKNSFIFTLENGQTCPGYSGSPILLLDKTGKPTGSAVGLMAGNFRPNFLDRCGTWDVIVRAYS